jgi:hypothetical protein
MLPSRRIVLILPLLLLPATALAERLAVKQDEEGVTVSVDGELFTRYLIRSGAKPVLYPVLGPGGKPMTRAYPLEDAKPDEKTDHIHQRSVWFTHDKVNGVGFWNENERHGVIAHRDFVKVEGGDQATIVARNDWLDSDGKKLCEDERTLVFGADDDQRWFDFNITLRATTGEVTFGDTKEGTFGIRVPGSMTVDTKKGGQIVNSDGLTDGAAWGKRAPWVDYHGPVEGETMGIAVMNHPSSFRYPTYWHVRTYGLFAANPFGIKDFTGGKGEDGSYTLKPGDSITLRYRVLLHRGDEKQGHVAQQWEKYAKMDQAR